MLFVVRGGQAYNVLCEQLGRMALGAQGGEREATHARMAALEVRGALDCAAPEPDTSKSGVRVFYDAEVLSEKNGYIVATRKT